MPQYNADDYMAKKDKNEDDIRTIDMSRIIIKYRRCPKCKLELPLSSFGLDSTRKDKLTYMCKKCKNEYNRLNRRSRSKKQGEKKIPLKETCNNKKESMKELSEMDQIKKDILIYELTDTQIAKRIRKELEAERE